MQHEAMSRGDYCLGLERLLGDRYDKAFVGHISWILGIVSSNDRCGTGT